MKLYLAILTEPQLLCEYDVLKAFGSPSCLSDVLNLINLAFNFFFLSDLLWSVLWHFRAALNRSFHTRIWSFFIVLSALYTRYKFFFHFSLTKTECPLFTSKCLFLYKILRLLHTYYRSELIYIFSGDIRSEFSDFLKRFTLNYVIYALHKIKISTTIV